MRAKFLPRALAMDSAEGCLSHAGRAHKTEDRAFHLAFQLDDAQEFEDPLLHLFEVVVVLVEDLFYFLDLDVVLGRVAPRQVDEPFYVGAQHGRLDGVGMHHLEALDLLLRLFFDLLRHLRLLYLLPEVLMSSVLSSVSPSSVRIAFICSRRKYSLWLFVISSLAWESIFACMLRSSISLPMISESFLSRSMGSTISSSSWALSTCEPEVGGGDVGEFSRLVDGIEDEEDIGGDHPAHGDDLLHLLLDVAHERFDLEGDLGDERLLDGFDLHEEGGRLLNVFDNAGLLDPLDEDLDPAVGEAEHPHDLGDDAHRIDPSGQRVLVGQVLLGRHEDEPVFGE